MKKILGISLVWILLSGSILAPIGFLTAFGTNGGLTINQIITTTVSSSQNPSTLGRSVTFTATVTPSSATGNVQFNDTSTSPPTTLGTGAISSGHATFTTSSLSIGSHNIVAKYLGDTNNAVSTSAPLTQTVNQVSTTATISLGSSAISIVFGQSVTFTATVLPSTATGNVQLLVNGATFGSPVALSGGHATFTTSSLPAGTYDITASYSGDANFSPNNSNSLSTTTTITITNINTGQVSTQGAGNDDDDTDNDKKDQKNSDDRGGQQDDQKSQENNNSQDNDGNSQNNGNSHQNQNNKNKGHKDD
ncbi:MAG: Ig-like domain repeat protein [Thaumarchaeota archaeon]|nr:MAG: Ig-like domain repeat protein [Nitrososphaerota archaeon]